MSKFLVKHNVKKHLCEPSDLLSCADSHDKHVEKSGLQSAASGTVARLRVIEPRFSTETAASKPPLIPGPVMF